MEDKVYADESRAEKSVRARSHLRDQMIGGDQV